MKVFDLALILVLAFIFFRELDRLREDNLKLRRQLNSIAQALDREDLSSAFLSPDIEEELRQLIQEDRQGEALARLQEITGLGLEENQDIMETIIKEW